MRPVPPSTSSLTITNPLHLYRAHLATSRLLPDPHQHRAALILQSVYHRLLDYTPPIHLNTRLQSLARVIDRCTPTPSTPRRLFPRLRSEDRESREIVRVLTTAESAIELDTPQGLLLSGEVGTGKSMLIDLLYHSLPTAQKRRCHFDAFMLHIFSSLEDMQRSPRSSVFASEDEYSLLRLARDTVRESPILFLDEFQLPDRASAKLVSGLLVGFWSMGGVLVGSSNRQPGELVKGAGAGREGEFNGFLEALGRRCEFWTMGGDKDWRRAERSRWWRVGFRDVEGEKHDLESEGADRGPIYCFFSKNGEDRKTADKRWNDAIRTAIMNPPTNITQTSSLNFTAPHADSTPPWKPTTLHVYGRTLSIPYSLNNTALFTFHDLCGKTLGPADYITLTSHYHTLFIDAIPTLTHSSLKNEARRFITLLDAVYESGVRLAIRIDSSKTSTIDSLFFPDAVIPSPQQKHREKTEWDMSGDSDAIQSEVFAESYQDLTAPFRPNIAAYDPSSSPEDAGGKIDFLQLAAFTGEDEKFAFRRAVSRLWEVCSEGWWCGVEWRPSVAVRSWEERRDESVDSTREAVKGSERDGVVYSPFRKHEDPPPRFGMEHFWSVVRWGRRAGNWGKGVEGVGERKGGR